MAREFEFSLVAELEDKASRGIKRLVGRLESLNDYARRGRRGLLGGLFGGFASRGAVSGPQGGLGGIISGIGRLAAKAVAMPAKIVGAFARMLPKIGDIAGGAINSVVNVLQGLAVTAANIAGHLVNVFVRAFRRVASVAGRVLGNVAAYGGMAAAGATAYSVWQAAGVEEAWARVSTIAGEVTDKVRRKVKQLSYDTGRQLKEVIGGYYQVLSAGITDAGKAFEFLRSALKGAVGGAADFETTVKAVSRTIRAMGLNVSDSLTVMDKLLKTVEAGQIEMPELAGVIGRVAGAGSLAGARLDELLAALGHLAQTGPPEVVATQLRAFLQSLVKLPAQARREIEKLRKKGIDLRPEVMQEEGMLEYVRRLQQIDRESLTNIIPRRRGLQGVSKLMDMLQKVESTTEEIDQASGKTLENYTKRMNTLTKQAGKAWNGIRLLATAFGEPIADYLKRILKDVRGQFRSLEDRAAQLGEVVRRHLEGVYEYLDNLAQGRDLSWRGIKGALAEVKKDAVAKALAAWDSIKNTLWPRIKSAWEALLDLLLDEVVGKVSELPSMVGSKLRDIASKRMQSLVEAREEELSKPALEKLWYSVKHPISGAWQGIQDLTGAMDPETRAQFAMWQGLARAGSMMSSAGAAGQQAARNARRRRRGADLRSRLQSAMRGAVAGEDPAMLTMQELKKVTQLTRQYMQTKQASPRQTKQAVQEIKEFMRSIVRDLDVTQQELQDLKRTVQRLSTARN